MNLIIYQNGNIDDRLIQYEKDVRVLGDKKAELQLQVDIESKKVIDLQKNQNDLNIALEEKKKKLEEYEEKLSIIRKQLADEVDKNGKNLATFKEKEKEILNTIGNEKTKIDDLILLLATLTREIVDRTAKIEKLRIAEAAANKSFSLIQSKLEEEKRKLTIVSNNVQTRMKQEKEINNTIQTAKRDLEDLLGQIKSLRKDNHGGLDALASIENERKRLRDREDFLDRKDHDLKIYENRLRKYAIEKGIDLKMTFK